MSKIGKEIKLTYAFAKGTLNLDIYIPDWYLTVNL